MKKTPFRVGIGAIVLAAVLGFVGFALMSSTASADPSGDTLAIDAIPGGGLDALVNVPVGSTFQVDHLITAAPDPYGAYQTNMAYNPSIVTPDPIVSGTNPVETNLGGATLCGGGTLTGVPSLYDGCARISGTSTATGVIFTWTLKCTAPGISPLHLLSDAEVGVATGSNFAITTGSGVGEGPLIDAAVNCTLPFTKVDNTGGTAVAGSSVTYTLHIGNPTSGSLFGHGVTDNVPAPLTVTSVVASSTGGDPNAFGGGCGFVGNAVTCTNLAVAPDPAGTDITIVASIPLSAAGQNGICNQATLDGTIPSNNDCFNVAPAAFTVSKTADAGPYKAGDPISWTINVTSSGLSPATGVVVTDTAADGFAITGSTGSANCTANPTTATTATFTCGTLASSDGVQVLNVTGTVNTPNPADQTCNNTVAVTSTNGASGGASASATCQSKDARVVKDADGDPNDTGDLVNLWICKDPSSAACIANGGGNLTINEWALNYGDDPQGLGAYEFQLKYDNHIFDISIEDSGFLYSTGRIPGDTGIGGCSATIITENDIRFGCVSKNPQPLDPMNGSCLGPDNVTPVPGAVCGPTDNAILATITVSAKADLIKRITPGNDNGAIRSLLDEGCELADIWGHPLSAANGAPPGPGYDGLGREVPLSGIQPGGQVTDCGDITITVRILEGDMDANCIVDVSDDQIEASKYGGLFGTLLYDPWYDLEPAVKDGDVDIKDLQKVFGRNGSTCDAPVPPQPALPQPGDP